VTGSRTIRLLHVVQNLNFGGMERLIAGMIQHADRDQFDVHLLALGYLGHFSEGLDRFATLHVARPMSKLSMLRPSSLADDIRSIAPDVVHSHGGVWYKASLAARMAGVPAVLHTDHGRRSPDPALHRFLDRRASSRTDVVVAVSERLGGQLRHIVTDPSRIRVIPNGVDTDTYMPKGDDGVFRAAIGIPADVPIIGSIGRLEHIKGYDLMIRAFAALQRSKTLATPRPVLVLIGDSADPAQRANLEQLAAELGVSDSIRFLGWRSDVESAHRSFAFFTMSSRSEGTSVSLLEAMSAGLCPIVTDVGGNAAVLGPTLVHRLIPTESPDALAAAWEEALANSERRATDATAARRRVMDHFSLNAMVRSYEAAYQSLAARGAATGSR